MASTIKVDKIAQSSGTPEFTIPTADGAANTFLKTDGSGVLSFGAVTTTALTGSTNTWIPTITAANALTGTANFTYDGNILDVKNSGTASSIKLYCESSNAHYQEIKAAPHSGSSNWTLTLPSVVPTTSGQVLSATTAGVASWADAGGGKVLQAVQSTDLSTTAIASTTFSDIGLSVAITPSAASSKVFCTVVFSYTQDGSANALAYIQMVRDSTALTSNNVGVDSTFGNVGWICVSQYLDSPNTTSATTYKIQAKTSNASSEFRPYYGDGYASIVCMEIGA